ncbi:MAG: hypothetical protein ACK46X_07695 [Candidatus Sericytochromatia bacterium]
MGREGAELLDDDDQVVTVAPAPELAVAFLREQGLGFDAVVLEPGVGDAFIDELRSHRDTENVPVVRVGDRADHVHGVDANLRAGYGRRELRDAVRHAMARRGYM